MKVEHFHICLLTDWFSFSAHCFSMSTGSWLSDETGQGWNGCPRDIVSPPSLEAFKRQVRRTPDERGSQEIHIVGLGLARMAFGSLTCVR